ncbi:hypothetical protein [Ramlibacter tataouinensis]|uniref:Candidate membrane protein n=1 Tax=Ramlibacter tataouinensis (strain ATCC BAA-407 / DSM 14655 / LMG 21543 / TTB310) TaxID=365046 RepID=F5XYM9_RAMTT|nr:hypothetical protein [Ramlibacter tataouinensis]AEG94396.1 hypothetical protein Rta_32850 [Ramlibacter tataouinensis TTB310]
MTRSITLKAAAAGAWLAHAGAAFAHEGHGLAGDHWHATDSFGLLLVGALAALAVWLSRGGQ